MKKIALILSLVLMLAACGAQPAETTAPAAAATARWSIQHRQRAAHARNNHFRGVTIITVAVLPFAGAQAAFDINLAPFFQEAFDHADQAVTVDGYAVPFGALFAFTGGAIFPLFRRRNAQIGDFAAILERLNFRIGAKIADQNDLVDAASHRCFAPAL